jgi:hypothetical protein
MHIYAGVPHTRRIRGSTITCLTGSEVVSHFPQNIPKTTLFSGYAELLRPSLEMHIVTLLPGYAVLVRSSQDMQQCYVLHKCAELLRSSHNMQNWYILHRIYRIVRTSHMQKCYVLHRISRIAKCIWRSTCNALSTGCAGYTELQLSPPQGIGEGHLVTLTSQEKVCIAPLHCTRKYFCKLQIYKIAKTLVESSQSITFAAFYFYCVLLFHSEYNWGVKCLQCKFLFRNGEIL